MSTNDDIQDALTRHQIFVQRYARGREQKAAARIAQTIRNGVARLEDQSPAGRAIAEANIADLVEYLKESYSEYAEEFLADLEEFAEYEFGVSSKILGQATDVQFAAVAPVQLKQAIFGNMMAIEPAAGYSIGGILNEFGVKSTLAVQKIAQDAILLGKSNKELTEDILGIIPTEQRKAATLARTITNHTANAARNETMKENEDVLDGYKWVATLDSRTSLICASRDQIVYSIDDRNPKPPAHFNCRSTITFVVKPEYDLGRDIEGTRPAKGDIKRSVGGNTNYGDWLRTQSADFQDKVLGPARGKLFREQNLPISRFVDDKGNILSLAELRKMDEVFNGVSIPEPAIPTPKVLQQGYKQAKNIYDTPVARNKFINEQWGYWGRHWDDGPMDVRVRHIETIAAEQGFDGLPTVVSDAAFDAIEAANTHTLYRGVMDKAGYENLMSGEYWGGKGIYGNGMYFAIRENYGDSGFGKATARSYAGERGYVMRAKLDPKAKIVTKNDLAGIRREMLNALADERDELVNQAEKAMSEGRMSWGDLQTRKEEIAKEFYPRQSLVEDWGALAESLGYDAIYVSQEGYMVVLNRTALTMSETVSAMGKGDLIP